MKIAVVDDMECDRAWLCKQLEHYTKSRGLACTLFPLESGEAFLEELNVTRFDIAFLDIYMGGITGMEAATALRRLDRDCKIVFLTVTEAFLRQGYSVNACHYLIKPVQEEDFLQAMENCRLKPPVEVPFWEVVCDGHPLRLDTEQILYLDVCGRNTNVHMVSHTLTVTGSFSRVSQPLLHDKRFFLPIQGVLVNMDFISDMEGSVFCLKNGECLPIAIRNTKKAIERYRSYLFSRMGGTV